MIPSGFLDFCGFAGCETGGFGEIKNPNKHFPLFIYFKGRKGNQRNWELALNTFSYSNSECLFLDNKHWTNFIKSKICRVSSLLYFDPSASWSPRCCPSEDLKMLKLVHPKQSQFALNPIPVMNFHLAGLGTSKNPSSPASFHWIGALISAKNLFGSTVTLLGFCPSFVFIFYFEPPWFLWCLAISV